MFAFIVKLLINGLALIITSLIVPGLHLATPETAFIAALVLGLVNTLIKPVINFFTLPLQVVTLGLFTLIINGLILALVAHLVPGLTLDGFGSALIGAIVLSVVSSILSLIFD